MSHKSQTSSIHNYVIEIVHCQCHRICRTECNTLQFNIYVLCGWHFANAVSVAIVITIDLFVVAVAAVIKMVVLPKMQTVGGT